MLANLVLLNKLLAISLRMLSDEIPNGHKSMYESLAQFSAGTANTNQMVVNCLFLLSGHAHDEGHASHNSTCRSAAQGSYPQIHYPAAHHYTRTKLFLIKTTRVLSAWLCVLDTSRAKQAAGKQKTCLVFHWKIM